jgi:hypothetical protein
MVREPHATTQPAPQDNQLMPKHRVLSLKPQLRLKRRGQDGRKETEQPNHPASIGDSITSSTRMRFSVRTGSEEGPAGQAPTDLVFDAADVPSSTDRNLSGAFAHCCF